MSISFDGDLQIINLDVQDLVGLTDDQIEEKITDALPDLSSSELQTFMEDLRTRLAEIEDELQDLQDGYENDLDESETTEGQSRYETKLEQVQEALDALDQIDAEAEDALERETFLNTESDQDISFTYGTSDLNQLNDGDVVNLTALAGSQSGIFDDETEEEVEATDTNGDGFITYDEVMAASVPDSTDQFAGQDVFLQVNSGDQITNVTSSGSTVTFTLVTSDGKTATINVNGDVNIYLQGSNYMDTDILSGVSEDILKRLYDNDDTMNMYDRLNDTEISEEERLSYIEHYDDINNESNFNSIVSTYGLSADFSQYSAALEKLFAWVDDSSSTKDSITTVWNEIYNDNGGTLSADLITALALGVALHGPQTYLQNLFGSVIGKLETSLGYDATATEDTMSANAKMTIALLETQCGLAGQLGGPSGFWSTAFGSSMLAADGTTTEYTKGKFTNHDTNITALNTYQQVTSSLSWFSDDGQATTALVNETALQTEAAEDIAPDGQSKNPTVKMTDDIKSDMMNASGDYAHRFDDLDITEQNCEEALDGLTSALYNLGEVDADTMRKTILDYMASTAMEHDTWKDQVLATFLIMLHDVAPDLFWDLSRDELFRADAWKIIDNGGDNPDAYGDIENLWVNAYEDEVLLNPA